MIQLNPNKRRKDKEEREKAAKKNAPRKKTGILTKGWEKGESKLQKAGLWIKKKTGVTSKNKGIVSSAVGSFGENVEKKQTGTKKTEQKTARKSRALMTKAQKKEADRKKRVARAKAYRAKK